MATISENLEALKTAKASIKSAMENKDIDLTDVPFTQFGEKLDEKKLGDTGYFWDIINQLVSGIGDGVDVSKLITSDITEIRAHVFAQEENASNYSILYANNLTIPKNVQRIRERAFLRTRLRGKLTIHDNCIRIYEYAFGLCPLSEVEINSGLDENSRYVFTSCTALKKITLGPNIAVCPMYLLAYCTALEEVVVKTSLISWIRNFIYNTSSVKRIIFETTQPCTVNSGGFYNVYKASLLVPYEYYDTYFNATNYQQYSNPMYGYGTFIVGSTLPATKDSYTIVWYATLDDLLADTNPVTECTSTDRYYGKFTEIVDTETTE